MNSQAAGAQAAGTKPTETLLARIRKLLAKAEAKGVTPAEAEALTAKAAELMAKYGIDRALLAAERPETDHPADRVLDVDNPWARVQAHLLCGIASAMRCQCVVLPRTDPGARIHVFGFASDIERADVLYTSLLVQMWQGLAAAQVPDWSRSPRPGGAVGCSGSPPPWSPGSGRLSITRRARPHRPPRPPAPGRRWCWPTGSWSSAGTSSRHTR